MTQIKRIVSGIQPSGELHLGNYFGAIKQHIQLQRTYECFYFIADYHALTTQRDAKALRQSCRDIAAAYIALGLNVVGDQPSGTFLYQQSDIPQVAELAWILNCVTPVGLMQRAPAYKEKVANGLSANMGLFSYPILMAADIIMTQATLVPVGKDQLPHVEMAQDIAESFNASFCGSKQILKRPESFLSETPKVPGTDGQKMSKSYGNTISIFAEPPVIRKQVARIVTDSRTPGTPGKWGADNATAILDLFLTGEAREQWIEAVEHVGVGYKEIKDEICTRHQELFGPAYDRYVKLQNDGITLDAVLSMGAHHVRDRAQEVLARVRKTVGLKGIPR